jgi:DNA invertase Pin-like site-specific DNA recombinase
VDVRAREKLTEALNFIREGDHLVVTKLDRLARSMAHLMEIRSQLEDVGAHLTVLGLNLDTSTAQGKLMLNLLGSVAEFEREIMLERQREGIAKAKAAGKYKGRKPTAKAKSGDVIALASEGIGATEISRRLGIGRASVYRILSARQ